MRTTETAVAIVGMDCRYPGAHNLSQYWDNILALRQQFRRMPDKRLNLDYYFSEDTSKKDYTYLQKAAVLSNYHFDRIKYRVSKSTFEQTDMAHWLALDVATGALKDAGFENGAGLEKKKVGVILGNSLNGEFTRANTMRLRWPYVFKVLESTLRGMNYKSDEIAKIIANTEKVYKAPFPEPDADTLAGGLSNTIAGRICNYFDFNGGGFTVDGACSSSLLSVAIGCNALMNEELSMVLVGGVDLSIDPFELVGFARNGALAKDEMEVYNAKSQGFWPGEGCGIIVLMKESQAIAQGLNIYGVIRGWGISSDGKGGITRPKFQTQQAAIEMAYNRAGYGADTVAMFEGHGTGTPLGDKVELTALVNSLKNANKKGDRPAIIGSVKHLIGHTKAAAGVAGMIKACLALKNSVIPASRPTDTPHNILQENQSILQLGKKPILWTDKAPMRASVSSMGFGGINVHITIEEKENSKRQRRLPRQVEKLSDSLRDSEVFPIVGSSKELLLSKIQHLQKIARDISRAEFIDLSATMCAGFQPSGLWKASLVASRPSKLRIALTSLEGTINAGDTELIDVDKGIFFNGTGKVGEIAFLFPGQGAPIYNDLGAFEVFKTGFLNHNGFQYSVNGKVVDTSIAQPAIVKNTLQSVELLENFGIEADWGIGNSLGEISALSWAGAIEEKSAIGIAQTRGKAMSELGGKGGAMLALKCNEATLYQLMEDSEVTITGYNGHQNYVIGGSLSAINEVKERAFDEGVQHAQLRVSHAFHTPMMKKAAEHFREDLKNYSFDVVQRSVISTVTGELLSESTDLKKHLFEQIEKPVQFTQAIAQIREKVDLLIEVGSGKALAQSLADEQDLNVVPLNFGDKSIKGLLNVLSAAFVIGTDVRFNELSCNRHYHKFDLAKWELDVLVNPCEKIDHEDSTIRNLIATVATGGATVANGKPATTEAVTALASTLEGVQNYVIELISKKTEIPVEVITIEDRIMSQLSLNSLAITEIISLITKTFNKSHKVFSAASILANSDGTIADVSKLIFEGAEGKNSQTEKGNISFDLAENWTHIFQRTTTPKNLRTIQVNNGKGEIRVNGLTSEIAEWELALSDNKLTLGNGSVYIYNSAQGVTALGDFVTFLNKTEVRQGKFVALVNLSSRVTTGDLRPVLRTFQQEVPQVATFSLELPATLAEPTQYLLKELNGVGKYKEVIYTSEGKRVESQCKAFFPQTMPLTDTIQAGDVILATGGGKGITYESIAKIAQTTGAKLAILGRSLPEKDEALYHNLLQLTNQKITYHYYPTDVCNAENVQQTINKVVEDLGPIKIVLHGAGFNKPKPLTLLRPEDFQKTLSVKVQGLQNVLNALDASGLKMLLGYGSIIAQSGMKGNADYAWANDQLALYIEAFSQQNEQCRCVTFEWSIWDEVGMGVNLNSLDGLKAQGVWPIPVKQGVAILEAILADTHCKGRFIISGRYGGIPTLNYVKSRLPLGRFISKAKHHVPEIEVVSEVDINLKDDIYLKNHVFQKQYVFPTVMILEGMAQVCSILQPKPEAWSFEDLQIHKSIFIPKKGINRIRFIVTRINQNQFKAVVQSEDSNFEVNCFEAIINYGLKPDFKIDTIEDCLNLDLLKFDVAEKFYDDLLFHHGPFRRINSFYKVHARESIAGVETNLEDKWFGPYIPDTYLLGDPGLNDAAIQCHQVCRPGWNMLPTSAGQVLINTKPLEGPFFIKTLETSEDIIDVCVLNKRGEVKEFWKDLRLTKVTGTAFSGQWEPHLLVPYIEYILRDYTNQSEDFRLPRDFGIQMLKSIEAGETSVAYTLEDCTVSISTLTEKTPKEPELNGVTHQMHLFTKELNILNFEQPVVLQITKQEVIQKVSS